MIFLELECYLNNINLSNEEMACEQPNCRHLGGSLYYCEVYLDGSYESHPNRTYGLTAFQYN